MESHDGRPIALIGLMGAGKSAVAALLGAATDRRVVDLDAAIAASAGCTIAELFEREGEARFRIREREALADTLTGGAQVIACGGGIVTDEASRALLERHCDVVWLEVSPAVAARRLAGQTPARPLLVGAAPEARLAELLAAREALYAACARLRVDTNDRAMLQVMQAVLYALGEDE